MSRYKVYRRWRRVGTEVMSAGCALCSGIIGQEELDEQLKGNGARRMFAALSVSCMIAAGQGAAEKTRVRWSPLLKLDSRKAIDERLARPFGDVFEGNAGGSKTSVANCNDYLRWSEQGFHAGNEREQKVLHNDAVECVALRMLRAARTPMTALLPGFKMTTATLSMLPPELAPAVSNELILKARAADAAGKSWATYIAEAAAKVVAEDQLEVSQPGWITRLSLYARGDFSGRGKEELLVRADYQAQGGTYATSHLFLLARNESGAKRLQFVRQVVVH